MSVTVPEPPTGIGDSARARWTAFWRSDAARLVDLDADLGRLCRWIQQSDDYDRVADEIGTDWSIAGAMGGTVLNPLVRALGQLENQLARTETEFGMTPLGRKRLAVKAEEAEQGADPLDELSARRLGKASGA